MMVAHPIPFSVVILIILFFVGLNYLNGNWRISIQIFGSSILGATAHFWQTGVP